MPAETRYSTYDRELLAIYLSIQHFRYFLEDRDFHVLTDHKPLTYSFASRPERHSPRQVRHLDYISQFTSDLRYVQGLANTAAVRELALAQVNDPDLPRLHTDSSLRLGECSFPLRGNLNYL